MSKGLVVKVLDRLQCIDLGTASYMNLLLTWEKFLSHPPTFLRALFLDLKSENGEFFTLSKGKKNLKYSWAFEKKSRK